jgi:serine protease Do
MKDIEKTIITSVVTSLATIAIVFGIFFYQRGNIFSVLADSYQKKHLEFSDQNFENKLGIDGQIYEKNKNTNSTIVEESTIVSAVSRANPAVVAITITKEIPKYKVSYNQNSQQDQVNDFFGNQFPNFFFNQPTYTQDGTEKKVVGGGSGFIVSADGYVVTNRHVVVDKTAEYSITLNNGKKYNAKVLARDQVLDIAILKIDAYGLPFLELGDSSSLQLGQSVIAIGNALGEFKNTISTGIISGLSRKVTAADGQGMTESLDKVIQTDAAINPGNSGGPLLNLKGLVIGVNVAVAQGAENIGFALPINSVKNVINQVRSTGKISRPYVGIRYIPITNELKDKNNLTVDYGILVGKGPNSNELAVIPGSPADKAGIVENDIILEVDGKKIDEDQNFAYLIREKRVGDIITLRVLSKGIEKTVTLTLAQAPDTQ